MSEEDVRALRKVLMEESGTRQNFEDYIQERNKMKEGLNNG